MENPNGEPEEILLTNLPEETYRLEFLVDAQNEAIIREMEISIKAGEIVGKLYDTLRQLENEVLKVLLGARKSPITGSLSVFCSSKTARVATISRCSDL